MASIFNLVRTVIDSAGNSNAVVGSGPRTLYHDSNDSNWRVLGSPNPGQSFGCGGAFRSGSNGASPSTVGKLGATKSHHTVVNLIFRPLILGPRMRATVV